jgi:hypothetical protein
MSFIANDICRTHTRCYKYPVFTRTKEKAMSSADEELHRAKRELESLIARMQQSGHARAFLGYADALIFTALRDLPAREWESPHVSTPEDLGKRAAASR